MVRSVTSSKMGEVHVYEAMYRYDPRDHEGDDDDSYILIEPGDVLEVSDRNLDCQPDNPQIWLNGYNTSRNLKGFFPGPYVKYLGKKGADGEVMDPQPVLPPIPPRPRSSSSQPNKSEMPQLDDSGKLSFSPPRPLLYKALLFAWKTCCYVIKIYYVFILYQPEFRS